MEDDERRQDQRQPSAGDDLHVRRVRDAEGEERVEDPGRQRGGGVARDDARQHVRAVRAEREAEERGQTVQRDGARAGQPRRKQRQGHAEEVLAVRQRQVPRREDRRVEQVQRLVHERVAVPVEDPGVEQRIALV